MNDDHAAPTYQGRDAELIERVHPKVRMLCNGDTSVNVLRSQISGSVAVGEELASQLAHRQGGLEQTFESIADRSELPARATRSHDPITETAMSVFVQLTSGGGDGAADERLPGERARVGNLVIADVTAGEIDSVSNLRTVAYMETGEPVHPPQPVVHDGAPDPPSPPSFLAELEQDGIDHKRGEGVLMGIIDVGGFDFAHSDFLDENGRTRFVAIWDQGGEVRDPPMGFGYGAEFTKTDLANAMKQTGLPPTQYEPQSVMSRGSHATHVASIAAGNRGICAKAEIAGVLLALSDDDEDRRRSFYDSTRIAHAVSYLAALADKDDKQLVVNISLGTNGHAHDGSSPTSRWLDALLVSPGRVVCVAAGNAGQTEPEAADDIGYVLGRVHCTGRIAAAGLRDELEWCVVGNGLEDVSENELEIWYPSQDRFSVQVKPPGGEWSDEVRPREFLQNQQLPNGTLLSIYNELYHPANGANHISVFLSPFLQPGNVRGVARGVWRVRLIGKEVRDGNYDCWIERDDPRPVSPGVGGALWRFPSFFGPNTFAPRATVSSLACGERVISVANHDLASERINITSSLGPTRDGRTKPDIAAPGTEIVAANGFDRDRPWIAMSGTSMASPHVAGVAGLMLATEPFLTAAQILGIIRRNAQPLAGIGFEWQQNAGFGTLNAAVCVKEAKSFSAYTDLDPGERPA